MFENIRLLLSPMHDSGPLTWPEWLSICLWYSDYHRWISKLFRLYLCHFLAEKSNFHLSKSFWYTHVTWDVDYQSRFIAQGMSYWELPIFLFLSLLKNFSVVRGSSPTPKDPLNDLLLTIKTFRYGRIVVKMPTLDYQQSSIRAQSSWIHDYVLLLSLVTVLANRKASGFSILS